MENTKNCFGYLALQSTCTAVGYFKGCGFKKKLKLDCSEFGALEINRVVDNSEQLPITPLSTFSSNISEIMYTVVSGYTYTSE